MSNQKNVDEPRIQGITRGPMAASRKVYESGRLHPEVRVPFREISQTPTYVGSGDQRKPVSNPPVLVYDTSGPYTDPQASLDLTRGLAPLRAAWIAERSDSEELSGISSAYGREREADPGLKGIRFPNLRKPRRARGNANVSQMHYARLGQITPEMEYVAIRENLRRRDFVAEQHPGQSWARPRPRRSRPTSCARRSPAAEPSSPPTSTTQSWSR